MSAYDADAYRRAAVALVAGGGAPESDVDPLPAAPEQAGAGCWVSLRVWVPDAVVEAYHDDEP